METLATNVVMVTDLHAAAKMGEIKTGSQTHFPEANSTILYSKKQSEPQSPQTKNKNFPTSSSRAFWLGKERFHFQGEASPIKERDNGRGQPTLKGS
ncbi:hypothetical protein CDAR_14791 [Caerostris darwini]|uniref:Uncharacterized protein n=1 Tax=Caerostris darwini TaxID=1538125 RepID=A0AAV4W914_9ARAC|nr:hypothetical protein CDAR_14791 [Caerostris darwini]